MNIDLNSDRSLGVRSVEVVAKGYRNRTSFGENIKPALVFLEPIAEAINSCLSDIEQSDSVVAPPDFILELPGLLLRGVHVMVSSVTDRLSHVIVRFQQFLGSFANLFHHDIGFNDGVSDQTVDLAINAFSDIVIPMLNACEAMRQGVVDFPLSHCDRMHELTCEIGFHVELLKRFIHQRGQATAEPEQYKSLSAPPFSGQAHVVENSSF